MIGHTLGAAGGIEAGVTALTLVRMASSADDQLRAPRPDATSTTCRMTAREAKSTWRSRTRWALAATTRYSSCADIMASERRGWLARGWR